MDAHVERVSELTKLARLIGEIRFGLLTTIAEDGSLWSRPISTQRASPEGEVWFFVKDDAPIAKELRRHSRVSICYAKPIDGSYVSISGNCELFSDRAKASELWDTTFQEWLPGGPDDPSLVVARVTVERAEYWDAPSSTWPLEAGFSVLAPHKRDDPEYHATINMGNRAAPVVIHTGLCPSCRTHHVRCSHRDFSTALGSGETTYLAALDLLRLLQTEEDALVDRWHRDKVEQAIADVRRFLTEHSPPRQSTG